MENTSAPSFWLFVGTVMKNCLSLTKEGIFAFAYNWPSTHSLPSIVGHVMAFFSVLVQFCNRWRTCLPNALMHDCMSLTKLEQMLNVVCICLKVECA